MCRVLFGFCCCGDVNVGTSVFQKYPERAVQKVLALMLRRGEIQHRMQRKLLYRVK